MCGLAIACVQAHSAYACFYCDVGYALFMGVLRMCAVYVRAWFCQMCVCVCWLFASVVVCALACVVLACMLGAELDDAV